MMAMEQKGAMGTEARMQADAFGRLKSALEDQLWNHDSLAEYVNELGQNRGEEQIFQRLAFRGARPTAEDGSPSTSASIPDLYQAMNLSDKIKLRCWWHENIHRQAYDHEDLRQRLSWRYCV